MAKEPRRFTNMIEIDGEKLKSIFNEKGISTRQIATAIGFNQSTISNWCVHNEISPIGAKSLELAYGIKLEDYTVKEEIPEEKVVPLNMADVSGVFSLETAFYKAMMKAAEQLKPEMEKIIYRAALKAEETAYTEVKEV